jgi:hypothetical protein
LFLFHKNQLKNWTIPAKIQKRTNGISAMNHKINYGSLPYALSVEPKNLKGSIKEARRYSASWEEIGGCGTVFPQYANEAEQLIEQYLGYVPFPTIYLPHEVFIRSLIAHFKNGQIGAEEYQNQLLEHIRNIRNDDMLKDGWVDAESYTEQDLEHYYRFQCYYQPMAKKRLEKFLGYEPSLQHSLYAEVYLRHLIAMDSYSSKWSLTGFDRKAITIVKFREVFTEKGIEAANLSPLVQWNF